MTTIQGQDGKTVQISAEQLLKKADTSDWFVKDIKIPPGAQALLEKYSGIPSDKVVEHIVELRDRAFKAWPYPCIGQLRFLDLVTSKHPDYPEIVKRVKEGQTFLDAGCCLGQDIRQLLVDGAPSSEALYGTDLIPVFFDLGYELFLDKETLKSSFVAADLTKPPTAEVQALAGKMDAISAQSLFHLFPLDDQKAVARNLVQLSRPQPGSMISGRQIGHEQGMEGQGLAEGTRAFAHHPETWAKLWEEIGEETGSKWRVQTWVEPPPDRVKRQKWYLPGVNFLLWTVVREV